MNSTLNRPRPKYAYQVADCVIFVVDVWFDIGAYIVGLYAYQQR